MPSLHCAKAVDAGSDVQYALAKWLLARGIPVAVVHGAGAGERVTERVRLTTTLRQAEPAVTVKVSAETLCTPQALLETLGWLWLSGVTVDWKTLWAGQCRRRVPLPLPLRATPLLAGSAEFGLAFPHHRTGRTGPKERPGRLVLPPGLAAGPAARTTHSDTRALASTVGPGWDGRRGG